MDNMVITKEEQIRTYFKGYSHVVILGAGASIASCKQVAERSGKVLPSMDNCLEVLGVEKKYKFLIDKLGSKNLEVIFSYLFKSNRDNVLFEELQTSLYNYFDGLRLSEIPTIYDYLILSLRSKDLIATFNWDPFLWQAYERQMKFTKNLPHIAFLHGNVALGICENCKTFAPKNMNCLSCYGTFKPMEILYPIEQKDYNSNPYIKDQWNLLSQGLKSPARVSIFGYSAPKSDIEAIEVMKKIHTISPIKEFAEFEIIDIQKEELLEESWEEFLFSHHYEIHKDFFTSSIMKFPRRTGELFKENILDARFYEENYPPKFKSLQQMWSWYTPLIEYEIQQGGN